MTLCRADRQPLGPHAGQGQGAPPTPQVRTFFCHYFFLLRKLSWKDVEQAEPAEAIKLICGAHSLENRLECLTSFWGPHDTGRTVFINRATVDGLWGPASHLPPTSLCLWTPRRPLPAVPGPPQPVL